MNSQLEPSENPFRPNVDTVLFAIALVAGVLPPGYAAYIGAYVTMAACIAGLVTGGWRETTMFTRPLSIAILTAIGLVIATVPFTYRSPVDLAAPSFILPMLVSLALGAQAVRSSWIPDPLTFAWLCIGAAGLALVAGGVEHFMLGVYRGGLGNNPIHYATMATMTGCLALVGVIATRSGWRYIFLLGPLFALGAAFIADLRGPMVGALIMTVVGLVLLTKWLWHERFFRTIILTGIVIITATAMPLVLSGNSRVGSLFTSALNLFRFTGTSDDIRVSLYASALDTLAKSPIVGIGLGQLMEPARRLYPEWPAILSLEHLHADWANFAVMSGGLGLVAYLLLLTAPLLALLSPVVRNDRPSILLVILLVSGQFSLGLSNAMFGILPQTLLYAVGIGYLLAHTVHLERSSAAKLKSPSADSD